MLIATLYPYPMPGVLLPPGGTLRRPALGKKHSFRIQGCGYPQLGHVTKQWECRWYFGPNTPILGYFAEWASN